MSVSVVIPNWNGRDRLAQLVTSLQDQALRPEEVIVVDNGSTDGSADWARRHGAKVIAFPENRGFARAVNAGVREAAADAVAILNNDVSPAGDWLQRTLYLLTEKQCCFVVGKLLAASDRSTLDGSYDLVSRGGAAWRAGHGRKDGPAWSKPLHIQFPPFTALVVWKSLFLRVGGLDEDFGSYLEDVDFGFRCASFGYNGWYAPDAIAVHEGSATLGRWHPNTVRQISRNQALLVARHYSSSAVRRFGWQIAIAQLLWGGVALRHGAFGPWLAGKVDALRGYAKWRRPGDDRVMALLESSEQQIRSLQELEGPDWYWRLYFALT